jgi:hypothetical protein
VNDCVGKNEMYSGSYWVVVDSYQSKDDQMRCSERASSTSKSGNVLY